ncbi:MAG: ABC transporter substrate-binding protein [Pseudomonadota bacterium]
MFTRFTIPVLIPSVFAFAVLMASTAPLAKDIRIGVEGAYPPFSAKTADGELFGFDIDIAWALCEEMGATCELVEQDWDGMIPGLLARKYDAIIASMSITEERKKRVDFSEKYYQTPARFVAKKGTALTDNAAALAGKRIGVQRGTIHQCYLEKAFPDAQPVLYPTQEEVFSDLLIGRIDAQLSDSIVALDGFLNTDEGKDFDFMGGNHIDVECHGEGVGVAVRKQDQDLRDSFSAAINTIRTNGVYQEINAKYFDFNIYGD